MSGGLIVQGVKNVAKIARLRKLVKAGAIGRFILSSIASGAAFFGLEKGMDFLSGGDSLADIPGTQPGCDRQTEIVIRQLFSEVEDAIGFRAASSMLLLARMLATCPPGAVKIGDDRFMNEAVCAADLQVAYAWNTVDHGEGSTYADYMEEISTLSEKLSENTSEPYFDISPSKDSPTTGSRPKLNSLETITSGLRKLTNGDPKAMERLENSKSEVKSLWEKISQNASSFFSLPANVETDSERKLVSAGLLPIEAIEFAKLWDKIIKGVNPSAIAENSSATQPVKDTITGEKVSSVTLVPTNILNLILGVYGPAVPSSFSWKPDSAKKFAELLALYVQHNEMKDGVIKPDLGTITKSSTHSSGKRVIYLPVNGSTGFVNSKHMEYARIGQLTSARRDEISAAWKSLLSQISSGQYKIRSLSQVLGGGTL